MKIPTADQARAPGHNDTDPYCESMLRTPMAHATQYEIARILTGTMSAANPHLSMPWTYPGPWVATTNAMIAAPIHRLARSQVPKNSTMTRVRSGSWFNVSTPIAAHTTERMTRSPDLAHGQKWWMIVARSLRTCLNQCRIPGDPFRVCPPGRG